MCKRIKLEEGWLVEGEFPVPETNERVYRFKLISERIMVFLHIICNGECDTSRTSSVILCLK